MAAEADIQTQTSEVFQHLLDLLRQTAQQYRAAAGAKFRHTGNKDDPGMFMILDSCLYSVHFGESNDRCCSMNMCIVGSRVLFELQLPAQYQGSTSQALSLFLHDVVDQLQTSRAHKRHSHRGIALTRLLGSR